MDAKFLQGKVAWTYDEAPILVPGLKSNGPPDWRTMRDAARVQLKELIQEFGGLREAEMYIESRAPSIVAATNPDNAVEYILDELEAALPVGETPHRSKLSRQELLEMNLEVFLDALAFDHKSGVGLVGQPHEEELAVHPVAQSPADRGSGGSGRSGGVSSGSSGVRLAATDLSEEELRRLFMEGATGEKVAPTAENQAPAVMQAQTAKAESAATHEQTPKSTKTAHEQAVEEFHAAAKRLADILNRQGSNP